jgi:ComEC/Rec2-related protein
MKNIFTPIFLFSLFMLFISHSLGMMNYQVIQLTAVIAAIMAALSYGIKKFKLSYGLITLAFGLLITTQFIKEKNEYYHITQSPIITAAQGQYVSIEGKLTAFPEIETEHSELLLETRSIEFQKKKFFKPFNIRIRVKGNLKELYKGDIIAIDSRIYAHNFNRNFYRNPMEDYVLVRKTHFNGYCKSARMVTVLEKTSLVWQIIGAWRNKIRHAIEKKYREPLANAEEKEKLDKKGVFLQAILIGERGKLTNDQRENLLQSGVYHLLAISGAHIGIIALFSLGMLKLLRVPFKKRYILTALVLIVFLVLSGFKISAERAVLMAIFIFVARILYLDINIFNIISLCGLFMLARNPAEFLDAGFILTFTLTAAIVVGRRVFLPLLNKIFVDPFSENVSDNDDVDNEERSKKTPMGLDARHPIQWLCRAIKSFCGGSRGAVSCSKHNTSSLLCKRSVTLCATQWGLAAGGKWMGEFLSANFSASLAALPLSLFYFKRYSFAGFFAGLVLVPLTAVITGLGVLLIPLAPVSSFLSQCLLFILDIPLYIFFSIVGFFPSTIDLSIFRASPSIFLVLLILTAFFLLPFARSTFQKITLPVIILLVVVLISFNIFFYSPDHLEVFYLDIGQGDSQVVVFPGGDALLIDGGGAYYSDFRVGERIVLPFLLQKRIKVKWVAVSHYHPDHVYGIAEIIPILKPGELWISSEAPEDTGYQKLVKAVPGSTRTVKINAPFIKEISGCTVELLYPERFIKAYRSSNNHSQVFKISDGHHSFLFTGDIEKRIEERLGENSCTHLRSDVIKVPHHGSASSSTRRFLECAAPRFAVFSYAVNNRFRFPHREVVENYKNRGVQTLSTAHSGGIKFISLPSGIKIETSK